MTAYSSRWLASRLRGIATPRLRLAPLAMRDAAELRALTDDPTITGAISFLSGRFTAADARALIRRGQGEGDCFLGIRLRRDGRLAGVIGAHLRGDDAIEIGYWMGRAFRRRGLAGEAAGGLIARLARRLPGRRIVAECRPENRRSWRLLARLGFCPTGEPGERAGRMLLVLSR